MSNVMLSTKPYLLRAFYDWIVDSQCTPYLLLDVEDKNVDVPRQYAKDGKIVLNISPLSVTKLQMNNDSISFCARFSGAEKAIYAPMKAILAIYAMENGRGIVFDPKETDAQSITSNNDSTDDGGGKKRGGHLKVVK